MDIVSQAKTIGEQFLNFYFQNPQNISTVYKDDSLMTFESELFMGVGQIMEKITSLKINSKFSNYEIQPTNGGILIYLSGAITIEGESNEIPFTRVFVLTGDGSGNFYIKNDIFKITNA